MTSPRFHVEQAPDPTVTDWERWERSWSLLIPKLRQAQGKAPRSFCMTCHRTVKGYGAMASHKVLGHDVDVPIGSARPIIER